LKRRLGDASGDKTAFAKGTGKGQLATMKREKKGGKKRVKKRGGQWRLARVTSDSTWGSKRTILQFKKEKKKGPSPKKAEKDERLGVS